MQQFRLVLIALVSAFASTIGIIGALIPLAVPLLVPGGGLEMTGFIYALAISVSLVDCAPFGTTGATIVASTVEEHRPTVNRHLTVMLIRRRRSPPLRAPPQLSSRK